MPKTKEQKKEILQNLEDKIAKSKSIVLAGFNALNVKENEELRENLKQENGEYLVAKKTLLKLAFKNKGLPELAEDSLEGKVAAIFSYQDEVSPAKVLDKFRKNKEDKVYFLAGVLEGKLINKDKVEELAKLPSKEELYAKLVGSINAPVSGFVNVLAANLKSLVYTLKAIQEKK